MEKIPAACAMDWSIQLEKGLRSLKPDKSIQVLGEIGRRLEWWMREPEFTVAECRMFDLIPGEDKLFLNAIFLRLADAFRYGNVRIKHGVVNLFMRMRRANKRDGKGILSTDKLDNYLELLTRVKEVFDKGGVEEKALALVLFGCWGSIVKDCVDIRYIVLSSLVSRDALAVKAALFAAGCFCAFSDDFANVYLEMLSTVVLSWEISRDVKLAGARAYARSWCSFSLADKAYKTGLKVLMDSSEDDFSAVMLISLSRVASRWMLLMPIQVEILTLFLSEEKSLHMQVTSLRCHRFILERGACNFPSMRDTVQKLYGILERSGLQSILQLEAMKTLHKILLFHLSIIPREEIREAFLKLLGIIKNMQQSSIVSIRLLCGRILADLSAKVLGRLDNVSSGNGPTLAFQVISFVLDEILLLVAPKVDIHQPESATEVEVKNMINILKKLVGECPHLHCLVLSNICLFINKLVGMLNRAVETEKSGMSSNDMTECGSNLETHVKSKLMVSVSKILLSCLQNHEETDAETNQALDLLKVEAENVCCCSCFDIYTRISYFLLLHLHSSFNYMCHTVKEFTSPSREPGASCASSILQLDIFTLDCAKKIIGSKSYWYSYKVGRNAACQGAWSTAAFMFEQLMPLVHSSSCACWLKSLAQFSTSEKEIQLFLLPDRYTSIVPSGSNVGERGSITLATNCGTYTDNLLRAWNTVVSAEEILGAFDMGHMFSFQRWFLTLRAKFLKSAADMMRLLDTVSFIGDGAEPGRQLQKGILHGCSISQALGPLMHSSLDISYRMNKVARELDLLLVSFMGMDRQSVRSISTLAFGCSLMAFTAGFGFLLPCLHSSDNYRVSKAEHSDEPFHPMLIEDLVGRLSYKDRETRNKLMILLKSFHNRKHCFSQNFPPQISYTYEGIILQKLCQYSVGEVFRLQNEATMVQQDDAASQILRIGSELLLNIISKLMSIPFQTPHHFFRVRPAVLSELFVMNEDGQIVDRSSILSGSHLSLSLCFQLKNMPTVLPRLLNKIYCIISCKTSPQVTPATGESIGQSQLGMQDQDIDDMMDLNKKLQRYVIATVKTNGQHLTDEAYDESVMVNEYVCFELNERGQGFSTCLFDVSSLPSGSHRIKWHSGGIDSEGSYWSLLPAVAGPLFTVCDAATLQ